MNELSGMVDQATQTPPPPPPPSKPTLEEMFHNKLKLLGLYGSTEAFSQATKNERKPNRSKYPPSEDDIKPFTRMVSFGNMFRTTAEDYMVCPHHRVRLKEHVSKKGWEYLKCPRYPCVLFCAKDKTLDYMREAYYRPRADVHNMWSCLLCFYREPATLQQSQSLRQPQTNVFNLF